MQSRDTQLKIFNSSRQRRWSIPAIPDSVTVVLLLKKNRGRAQAPIRRQRPEPKPLQKNPFTRVEWPLLGINTGKAGWRLWPSNSFQDPLESVEETLPGNCRIPTHSSPSSKGLNYVTSAKGFFYCKNVPVIPLKTGKKNVLDKLKGTLLKSGGFVKCNLWAGVTNHWGYCVFTVVFNLIIFAFYGFFLRGITVITKQ